MKPEARTASGKWIEGLAGDMNAATAARDILKARLMAVCEQLPLASSSVHEDAGIIKRLRVATRRAEAALIAVRPCLKNSRYGKMRKHLRRIRKAAGDARTCDVHAGMFANQLQSCTDDLRPILEYVLSETLAERCVAQQAVDEVAHRYRGPRLRRKCQALLKSVKQPSGIETFVDLGASGLRAVVEAATEAAHLDLSNLENLHELRRKCKRLRYSLEVFRCCFDSEVHSDLYQRFESLQERLGAINDSDEIFNGLRVMAESVKPKDGESVDSIQSQLDELTKVVKMQLDTDVRAFSQWFAEFRFEKVCAEILEGLAQARPVADEESPERMTA